jgi:hypothetical protein
VKNDKLVEVIHSYKSLAKFQDLVDQLQENLASAQSDLGKFTDLLKQQLDALESVLPLLLSHEGRTYFVSKLGVIEVPNDVIELE